MCGKNNENTSWANGFSLYFLFFLSCICCDTNVAYTNQWWWNTEEEKIANQEFTKLQGKRNDIRKNE